MVQTGVPHSDFSFALSELLPDPLVLSSPFSWSFRHVPLFRQAKATEPLSARGRFEGWVGVCVF